MCPSPVDPELERFLAEKEEIERRSRLNAGVVFVPEKTERSRVLEDAANLIDGPREVAYGAPSVNFQRIADMLNGMFGPKLSSPLTRSDVAAIMICLKLSRQVNASKRDNWVDICGYSALGAEVDDN